MKETIILLIVATLMFSCNQNQKKTDAFFANFDAESLPLDFPNSEIDNFNELNRVLPEFLDMLVDTTGKMTKTEDGWHYTIDYFFKYHISTEKDFDLIILGEYPSGFDKEELNEAPVYFNLYTISPKTGEIFDEIKFAYELRDIFQYKSSSSKINEDLTVNISIIDSISDEPDDNLVTHFDIYKIDLK